MRVTKKHLEFRAQRLNSLFGASANSYTKLDDGKFVGNIGHHYISYCYGGACLHVIANEGGGVHCPIINHHVPKRELLGLLDAYISGVEESRRFTEKLNKGE